MLFGKRKRHVKRVLIIEDEPLTAFDNEMLIEDAGFVVVATHDHFEDAVAELDAQEIDIIFSDVRLRGDKTGIEVAEEAKKRGVPVVFVTGHAPDNAHELAIALLKKPYKDRQLKAALDAIDRHCAGECPDPVEGLELFPLSKD